MIGSEAATNRRLDAIPALPCSLVPTLSQYPDTQMPKYAQIPSSWLLPKPVLALALIRAPLAPS
jgi:hypothetical protein